MTDSERALVKEQLSAGREALLAAVEGLSEAQAGFKPSPEAWSILECLEHVAVAERQMLNMIQGAGEGGRPSAPDRDLAFAASARDRSRKFVAPDPAKPRGRYATLEEARRKFIEYRERTVAFVERCSDNLRTRNVLHPIAGQIDAYRCLLLIAAHPSRHAAQILEVRAHPAFPNP